MTRKKDVSRRTIPRTGDFPAGPARERDRETEREREDFPAGLSGCLKEDDSAHRGLSGRCAMKDTGLERL